MLKSLLISGAVITGAAVVACVAYLGKKAVNTLEEVVDTIEEEELEPSEVMKEVVSSIAKNGDASILYDYAPNTTDDLLDAFIVIMRTLNAVCRVVYLTNGLIYGYRFSRLLYCTYLKPRFATV